MAHQQRRITAYDCRCEVCGHEWRSLLKLPPRCASSRCKSLQWDGQPKRPVGRPRKIRA